MPLVGRLSKGTCRGAQNLLRRAVPLLACKLVFVKAFIPQLAVESFYESILYRLSGLDVVPSNSIDCPAQHRDTSQLGAVVADNDLRRAALERQPFKFSHDAPPNEVSTTMVRHSRLKSSTMARMRKRRPSLSVSETKSSDQRWLIVSGSAIGARVPNARLRPPRPDGMDLAQVSTASEHMQRSADVELQALAVGPPWPANDSLLDDAV